MGKFDVIVFDGYNSSTMNVTRKSRSVRISQTVKIDENYMCTTDRNEFLTNYTSKENFVTALPAKLEANGIKVVFCPGDADTIIVKVALEYENRPVIIFADDVDILCLLLHHLYILRDHGEIYLKNMTRKNDTEIRSCYHIQDIIDASENVHVEYILFCHAFTGYDTISTIHMFGKTSILAKLKGSSKLRNIADQFYLDDMSEKDIGNATIRFFELLHFASSTLQRIRKQKFNGMVAADCSKVDPALLQPSPRAVFHHGFRVGGWGWVIENKMYTPIMTDIEAGPPDLLKVIRCGCKGPCGNSCSCRKAGLNCASTCKECHGITCTDAPVTEPEVEEDEHERNFLDIFY